MDVGWFVMLLAIGFAGSLISSMVGIGGSIIKYPMLLYIPPALGFTAIRNDNEIMRTQNRKVFTEYVAGAVTSEKPPNFEDIIAINRGELQVDPERAIDLEIGPNRCAVHHHPA